MQQYLPFTVLKHEIDQSKQNLFSLVATVLTVYGIETICRISIWIDFIHFELQQYLPFTVLKQIDRQCLESNPAEVATVLTVYGIETSK